MDPFNNPKFKREQAKWYSRLRREGFKDIEQSDGHLKDYSFNIAKGSPVRVHHDVVSARFEYYSACRAFLTTNFRFHRSLCPLCRRDTIIWKRHTEGMAVSRIAKILGLGTKRVQAIIDQLEGIMKQGKDWV